MTMSNEIALSAELLDRVSSALSNCGQFLLNEELSFALKRAAAESQEPGIFITATPEQFEQFKAVLDANSIGGNMQLQSLLSRPERWYNADGSEGPNVETVPKHKFDTLVQHCKRLDADIAQARAHVNEVTLYQENAVWFWQHDSEDYLESLACPIIIQPHHLRELLKHDGRFDALGKPYTYKTTQATRCAGCGERNHTPLRVDGMDGYVCLTCIDKRLEGLLAEESARCCVTDWDGCQEVADLPAVHEALEAFSADSTGDAGVTVVQAVIAALELKQAPPALELTDDVRCILGQICTQCIHTARALRLMGHQIANKAEDEQAASIHWMLGHYARDPENWRANATAELKAASEAHKDK